MTFTEVCQQYNFPEHRAKLLEQLIADNGGLVNAAMIRGNFPIGYGAALALAAELNNNGLAKLTDKIPNMKRLSKEDREGGWFGT